MRILLAGITSAASLLALTGTAPQAVAEDAVEQRRSELIACVWEARAPLETIDCGRPFTRAGTVAFAQCWSSRPSGSVVFRRVDGQWRRTSIKTSVYSNAPACPGKFPFKSVSVISVDRAQEGTRQHLRLGVPAAANRPAMGVQFGVCVMAEKSTRPCVR